MRGFSGSNMLAGVLCKVAEGCCLGGPSNCYLPALISAERGPWSGRTERAYL